jgi:hypothetical protein
MSTPIKHILIRIIALVILLMACDIALIDGNIHNDSFVTHTSADNSNHPGFQLGDALHFFDDLLLDSTINPRLKTSSPLILITMPRPDFVKDYVSTIWQPPKKA